MEEKQRVDSYGNIFKNAKFGDCFKTRDGRKAVYLGDNTCWIEGGETEIGYSRNGLFVYFQEHGIDIVSKWSEELSEEEYKNKLDELYESCVYWEAYEDEPELFAESLKELLDFAPKDKKTIDYCAYLIKSRKTILNEIDNIVISFAKDESKEITINYGNV